MKKYNVTVIIPLLMFLLLGCGGGGTTPSTNDTLKKEETPQKKVEKKEPVDVIDTPKPNTAPTLTLSGDLNITVTQYKSYVELGFIAEDKEDGNITKNVQVSSIDTNTLGEKILNYSVKDSDGLKTTASRIVHIVPSEAPLLKILGSSKDTYYLGQPYTEHGYSAWDKEDGDLEVTVDKSDLDMHKVGTYKISYSIVDSDSNSVVKYRTIIVSDSLKISNKDIRELVADTAGNLNTTFNLAEFIMPRESGERVIKTYENGTLTKKFIQTTELIDENTSLLSFSHTSAKTSYSLNADTIDIKILHKEEVVSSYMMNAYTRNTDDIIPPRDGVIHNGCTIKEYYNSIRIDDITYQDTIMISCHHYYITRSTRNSYFVKGKGFLLSDENKTVN